MATKLNDVFFSRLAMIEFLLLMQLLCCNFVGATLQDYTNTTSDAHVDSTNVTTKFEVTSDTITDVRIDATLLFIETTSDITMIVTEGSSNRTVQTSDNSTVSSSIAAGHISKAQLDAMKRTLWLYVVPVILPFGILGNILGVWFMVQRRNKQSFDIFLLALISADLFYLVITLFENVVIIMDVSDPGLAQLINCYCGKVFRTMTYNAYSTCTHLVCLMAFERLIHVLLPFWRRKENFRKQTIAIIFAILTTNVLFRIPALMMYEPKYVTDPQTNITACRSVQTQWAKDHLDWHDQYIVIMLAVTQIAPLLATIFANISIIVFLSRQRVQRAELFAKKETRGQHYQQYITTLTLIILSVCLTTSLLPSVMMSILGFFMPETYSRTGNERYTASLISEIGFFLRVISSSTDFVVYIWLSTTSRTRFIKMIKRKLGVASEEGSFNDLDTNYNGKSTRGTQESSFRD